MAIAFVVERDLEYTKFSIDDREFVRLNRKEKYGTGSVIDGAGINEAIDRIDSWSVAVLQSRFSHENSWRAQDRFLG